MSDDLLHDLRLGIAELNRAKTPIEKARARAVIKLILWENRFKIVDALERIAKPRS